MDLEIVMDNSAISDTFNNLDKIKGFLATLEYIDQPTIAKRWPSSRFCPAPVP